MHNYIDLKMLKFTLKFACEVLLRVSAFHNHNQFGLVAAYAATRPNWFCKRRILTGY